ncbi:MAG: hypothetical protein H6810_09505 [Phycisphaeraceae bacterium]|nr:MAG: hypothetical protein H6810_09505 [Phycisphaeraceae bacterium]
MSFLRVFLRSLRPVLAVLAACLPMPRALAGPPEPASAFEGVDAELMIQIDDLAGQLQTPAGRSLRSLFDGLGVFTRTRSAWEGLSGALDMTPDQAIDHLLGGRVLIIADDVGAPTMRWACVMEVSDEIARLVPARLKASPRDTMDGRAVYAVEDGRFRVVRIASQDEQGLSAIAIAHAGADGLLRAGAELGSRWTGGGARGPAGVATVLYRPAPGSWLFGQVHPDGDGWRLSFSATPALFGPTKAGAPTVSRAWFDRMSGDALFAFTGPVSHDAAAPRGPAGWFDLGPSGLIWRLLPFEAPEAFVESGAKLASVSLQSAGPGKLDCSLGFLVDDATRAAKVGDAYVCEILGAFTGSAGYDQHAPLCAGDYPGAARLQTVDVGEQNAGRSVYGPRLSFVWGLRPDGEKRDAGWWTMRVLSENVPDAVATLMRHDTPIDAGGGDRAAILGRLRPAGLLAAGAEEMPKAAGPIAALRWVDEVSWWVGEPIPTGLLSGELALRMQADE